MPAGVSIMIVLGYMCVCDTIGVENLHLILLHGGNSSNLIPAFLFSFIRKRCLLLQRLRWRRTANLNYYLKGQPKRSLIITFAVCGGPLPADHPLQL